ncbi:FAD-dependent oxidoreductase [Bradyrhizobium sp. USDA 376]
MNAPNDRAKPDTIAFASKGGTRADQDWETDVLVIGSGAAGLSAALDAAKAGLRVIVCEKSPRLGGTTALSNGMIWVPCSAQARARLTSMTPSPMRGHTCSKNSAFIIVRNSLMLILKTARRR